MSASDNSGPSTTNRRYNHDLMIGCHCQNFPPTFLDQIPNKDFRPLPEALSFADFDALFQEYVCILCFVCRHNVNNVLNHATQINRDLLSRLILCTADLGISGDHGHVVLVDTETGELDVSILRKIHTVLDKFKLYDDTGPLVVYNQTLSDMDGVDRMSLYAQDNIPTVTMPLLNDDEHLYEPLSGVSRSNEQIASEQFLEASTLKPNRSGIQIWDSLCLPTGNTRDDDKFVRNILLQTLKSEHRLSEITEYLTNSDIADEVIDILTEVCFHWNVESRIFEEITGVLEKIWSFLDKRKGDIVMVKNISRLSNLLIAKLLLLHLNLGCENGNLVQLFEKILIPRIRTWLAVKSIDKKVKDCLEGSKLLMKDFVAVLKRNHSALELGEWKERLKLKENQDTLLTVINRMTLIEKVTCVLGLISLKCDSTVHIIDLPMLVEKACRGCFVMLKREKETKAYTYVSLTTRAFVYLIKHLPDKTETNRYMNVMEKMLNHKAWTKDQKETLLHEMKPFVLHRCQEIRWMMLNSFDITCDMGHIVRVAIQNGCRAARLYIEKEDHTYGNISDYHQKPHWSECKGVFGEVEVRIKILVPTKNCIAEGINDKYMERQSVGHERLGNTLSVLVQLHEKGGHQNIVKLLSYQLTQMPLFYAIEAEGAISLLKYFLYLRENGESCSLKTLYRYIYDAVSAMCFLHSENIVHRDITTCRFDVWPDNPSLRLSDFRLAKKLHRATDTLCLDDSNTLAVRWSAVESLQKDEFSIKSDTWMFALFMYEVFTHGCWPYSEHSGKETDDIMHMVITRGYNQSQPPCIPDKTFKLMLSCWDRRVERRPSMYDLQKNIKQFLWESEEAAKDNFIRYPKLQEKQKKNNGQPELGLPPLIQQLKDKTAVPYYNTKARPMTELPLQHEDLIGDFEPDIVQDRNQSTVTITEGLGKFSKEFTLKHYNQLREMIDLPVSKIVDAGETYLCYTYKDRGGKNLIDYAFTNGNCRDLIKQLFRLAKQIKKFHDNNWIVRCFSAKDIWQTGKRVCLMRLGRTCLLQNDTAGSGHVIDEPFKDRLHWLPLEVHRDHCYTKKSDVYMFAMVIYEVFTAMFFNRENPLRNPLLCVPFAMKPRSELQDVLLIGMVPERPVYCPISLYKLMKQCWSRDRVNRPTICDIIERIKDILRRKDFNTDDDFQTESSAGSYFSSFSESETDSDSEDDLNDKVSPEAPPLLPKRGETIENPTSQVVHSNESSSDDSFPNSPKTPLAHVPPPCMSRSSSSSSLAHSDRDGKNPTAEAISINGKLEINSRLFWRNDKLGLAIINSSTDALPSCRLNRCISEDNNIYDEADEVDYLNPVYSSRQQPSNDKLQSCDSSTSNDSFPRESPKVLQPLCEQYAGRTCT